MTSVFLDAPGPVAFAHRGYSPAGAENSMAAFAAAVGLGYRYVETDARVTADGVALAFHDDRLDRVTDSRGVLTRLPWSQVSRARIRGSEPIPRLDDLLGEWPQLRVNIDVKSDRGVPAALDAIRRTSAHDRVCLAAFSDARIRRMRREMGPDVVTALGPGEVARLVTAARSPRAVGDRIGHRLQGHRLRGHRPAGRCAQLPPRLAGLTLTTTELIDTAHRAGLAVHVWTINDAQQMTDLLDAGVDGIMTDEAEVLRDVLHARGQWPDPAGN